MQIEELIEWVRSDPEKFEKLYEAEKLVVTGAIEIHYHNGIARKIRQVPAPMEIRRQDLTEIPSSANT